MSAESASQSDSLLIQVEHVFEREIVPLLKSHLGGGRVLAIDDAGTVDIEFTGACANCSFRRNTIVGSIYPRLRVVDGVNSVTTSGVAVTAQQQHRMAALFDDYRSRSTTDHITSTGEKN